MQAVVLAGGLGTRLRSRVADRPKSLAPVAGRPFLEYLLDGLSASGCQRVVLATGHLSEMIESRFGSRHAGLALEYSREETPLGTGGAVVRALQALPDEPTLVMNGDTWVGLDLARFEAWCAARPEADAIVLRRVDDASRYGTVRLEGDRITEFGGKSQAGPALINAGLYRVRRGTFAPFGLPPAFSIENDFFKPFAPTLGLRGFVTEGEFIDIGVPDDYDRAQVELPRWLSRP